MQIHWGDPVERVFGIVIVGAIIVSFALLFLGPDEILGMPRIYFIALLSIGAFGAALGLLVVRWFRQRGE
jgi:hypothetical protein